jgi:hypothetical protein
MRQILVASCLALCACSSPTDGTRPSPSVSELDVGMYSAAALEQLAPADAAYVMGHAAALYVYGKTLPDLVRPVGFLYRPGISAPIARVPYNWVNTVTVISGGSDGSGGGIEDYGQGGGAGAGGAIPSDLPPASGTKTSIGSSGSTGGTGSSAGTGTGSGTTSGGGGETYGSPTGGSTTTSGGQPPSGGASTGGQATTPIDASCETFLNPAAAEARALCAKLDVDKMLGGLLEKGDANTLRTRFRAGMAEALYLQNDKQNTAYSEPEAMKKPVRAAGMCTHSPLILDLDGNGVRASTIAEGVGFDLLGRGEQVRTAWPVGGDALLALDRDGDGRIGSGAELFGNSREHADGFAALAALDGSAMGGNGDGVVDARDAAFAYLVAWRDANRDGVSDAGELWPLARLGITSISLASQPLHSWDEAGNAHSAAGTFTRVGAGGVSVTGAIVDVWFRYRPIDALASR